MRTRPVLASAAAVVAAAALAAVVVSTTAPASAQQAGGFDFTRPEVVATNLTVPWGMGALPDGSVLISERNSGRIMQLRVGQTPVQVATINGVSATGEAGLLGIAVSPTYAQDQWIYAYFTSASDNRIVRFRLAAPQTQPVILSGLARASIHDGGRLAFGPDGMLYATVGDAGNTANAQNQQSLNGKILRMTPSGGVPAGNPFGTLVYSLGHRNPQGLAWDAQGRLWAAEFGQNTWDEINQIVAGGNYGWPTVEGMGSNPQFRNPAVVWTTAEASPSGLAFANNTLFAAALRGTRLWTVPVNANGTTGTPLAELQGQFGRLRTVMRGPGRVAVGGHQQPRRPRHSGGDRRPGAPVPAGRHTDDHDLAAAHQYHHHHHHRPRGRRRRPPRPRRPRGRRRPRRHHRRVVGRVRRPTRRSTPGLAVSRVRWPCATPAPRRSRRGR